MAASDNETRGGEATFGRADSEDVDALVSIDSDSPRPWTASAFVQELERDPPSLFALSSSGLLVGFVVARTQLPDLDIVNLAVARAVRRRGLGRSLLKSLLDRAADQGVKNVFLEVREGNLEARRLYLRFGFEVTQTRPAFYREPVEDAILMRLEIGPSTG